MGSHCRAAITRAAILSEQTPQTRSMSSMSSTSSSVVWVCISIVVLVLSTEASCPFEGKEICEGAVTKELSTLVKICVDGRLKLKKKSEVAPGWPKAGGECVWYGEVLCDGAVVQDLYRWWFLQRCSKGRMSVVSRSWSEVTQDERYKAAVRGGTI